MYMFAPVAIGKNGFADYCEGCRLPYALDHLQSSDVPADNTTEMVKYAWYL